MTNFENTISTILISPRRWGKSSLVKQAAKEAAQKNKKLRFCFIDLYAVRTEEEFYKYYAEAILKVSSSKWEEQVSNAKKFLVHFIPKLSIGNTPDTEFSLNFDWETLKKNPDQLLNLPATISKEKNIKLIVCIAEFQNLSYFEDPLAFPKKLRSFWQTHHCRLLPLWEQTQHDDRCIYQRIYAILQVWHADVFGKNCRARLGQIYLQKI